MDPVAIMEMVIVQGVVAAETSRISDQRSPIIVVIEQIGALAIGIQPGLQLCFETREQAVERSLIALLGDGKQLRDSIQLFAQEISITPGEMIALVDDA